MAGGADPAAWTGRGGQVHGAQAAQVHLQGRYTSRGAKGECEGGREGQTAGDRANRSRSVGLPAAAGVRQGVIYCEN